MNPPPIGILGGMGPQAGLDLASKVFAETEAASDQEHLPLAMLSYSHTIADRTRFVMGLDSTNPGPAIASKARQLASLGVRIAGIPCNSAHAPVIFDAMKAELEGVGIRILHLIQETVAHIRALHPDAQHIGCLSTLSVHRLGLYRNALNQAGLIPVMPEETVAEHVVQRAIYDTEFGIKACPNPVTKRAEVLVASAVRHCVDRGADAVILGCTELPLALRRLEDTVLIDPARALARALIRESAPHKLRPL